MLVTFCFYTFLCTSEIHLKEKASFEQFKSAKVRTKYASKAPSRSGCRGSLGAPARLTQPHLGVKGRRQGPRLQTEAGKALAFTLSTTSRKPTT